MKLKNKKSKMPSDFEIRRDSDKLADNYIANSSLYYDKYAQIIVRNIFFEDLKNGYIMSHKRCH